MYAQWADLALLNEEIDEAQHARYKAWVAQDKHPKPDARFEHGFRNMHYFVKHNMSLIGTGEQDPRDQMPKEEERDCWEEWESAE